MSDRRLRELQRAAYEDPSFIEPYILEKIRAGVLHRSWADIFGEIKLLTEQDRYDELDHWEVEEAIRSIEEFEPHATWVIPLKVLGATLRQIENKVTDPPYFSLVMNELDRLLSQPRYEFAVGGRQALGLGALVMNFEALLNIVENLSNLGPTNVATTADLHFLETSLFVFNDAIDILRDTYEQNDPTPASYHYSGYYSYIHLVGQIVTALIFLLRKLMAAQQVAPQYDYENLTEDIEDMIAAPWVEIKNMIQYASTRALSFAIGSQRLINAPRKMASSTLSRWIQKSDKEGQILTDKIFYQELVNYLYNKN